MRARRRVPAIRGEMGLTVTELLVVMVLLGLLLTVSAPAFVSYRSAARAETAARELGGLFRKLRHRAVAEARNYGVVFHEDRRRGWRFAVFRDGDHDGLRSRDMRRGVDELVEGPWYVAERWPEVELRVPPDLPREGPPPGEVDLSKGDPVHFGRSDIVSFSPLGASSSGTIYLGSGERHWAIVVYGPTVRVRLWERMPAGWVRR